MKKLILIAALASSPVWAECGAGISIPLAPSPTTQTYITPSGTYMVVPSVSGGTTTVLQVSGARK